MRTKVTFTVKLSPSQVAGIDELAKKTGRLKQDIFDEAVRAVEGSVTVRDGSVLVCTYLTPETSALLASLALRFGVSKAVVLREGIEKVLTRYA